MRCSDVRQAEQVLIQKFYLTNAARAAFYPNLSLSGSLVQPIFSKGANKARLKAAQAEQEAALYNFRQTILDAGVDVNDALMKWQTAQKRLDVNKRQVLHLRAAVWNTKLLMKLGIINLYRSLGGGYDPAEDAPAEAPKKKKDKKS